MANYDGIYEFIESLTDKEFIELSESFWNGEPYPVGANAESWNFAQCMWDNYLDEDEVYDRDDANRFMYEATFEYRSVYNRIKNLMRKKSKKINKIN